MMLLATVPLHLAFVALVLNLAASIKLNLVPNDGDDHLSVAADFAAYKDKIGLTFTNEVEEAKAKTAFEHVRNESKLNPGVAITEFSHIPHSELLKIRTGFVPPAIEPERVATLPPFSPLRYKGQLEKHLKDLRGPHHDSNGRQRRQTASFDWNAYVKLMASFGYPTSKLASLSHQHVNLHDKTVLPDYSLTTAPKSLDWRQFNVVSPVKNQGACGACWAFGTVAAIESQRVLCQHGITANGPENDLSEQELIGCFQHSCNGYDPASTFYWIGNHGGLPLESTFPYAQETTSTVRNCPAAKHSIAPGTKTSAIIYLAAGNETLLKIALAYGPITVCINADSPGLMHYDPTTDFWVGDASLQGCNHEVLLVGYGSDPKLGDFWIIKNSWGAGWGNKGFARIARNRGSVRGITQYASIATMDGC